MARARRRAGPRRGRLPGRRHLQHRRHPVAWPGQGDRRASSRRRASPRSAACAINISGCTNSCGQHHAADIGFFGAERRAHGQAAPGYQMLLGGYVGQEQIHFGDKALRLPAKAAPEAAVRVVRRFAEERERGRDVPVWLDRAGGATVVADGLTRPRRVPVARRRVPSSTSTTTRPGRSWRRSASRSARPDAGLLTGVVDAWLSPAAGCPSTPSPLGLNGSPGAPSRP